MVCLGNASALHFFCQHASKTYKNEVIEVIEDRLR